MDHLIVTADDFGLAPEVNDAVEKGHREGIVSAASLMAAGPAVADAVRRARSMPRLRVGLHIVLVDGRPLLPPSRIPDLVDDGGRLRTDMGWLAGAIAVSGAVRRQVAEEIEAQFDAFASTGLPLDHVNAHKHFHLHPVVASMIVSIGARYGMRGLRVPIEPASVLHEVETATSARSIAWPWTRWLQARARRAGLCAPQFVFGLRWSGRMTSERLAGLIGKRPSGVVEIYTHPATSDTFDGHARNYQYEGELAALCDRACIDALRASGTSLGGYSDMPPRVDACDLVGLSLPV